MLECYRVEACKHVILVSMSMGIMMFAVCAVSQCDCAGTFEVDVAVIGIVLV